MNDKTLAELLGWQACAPLRHDPNRCATHSPGAWIKHGVCREMQRSLGDARAGIALASDILIDLIAELRTWSDSALLNPDTELHVNRMAERAEARLREVQGE